MLLINSDGRVFNVSNLINYLALSFELVYKILSYTECWAEISNFCVLQGSVATQIRWSGKRIYNVKFQSFCLVFWDTMYICSHLTSLCRRSQSGMFAAAAISPKISHRHFFSTLHPSVKFHTNPSSFPGDTCLSLFVMSILHIRLFYLICSSIFALNYTRPTVSFERTLIMFWLHHFVILFTVNF